VTGPARSRTAGLAGRAALALMAGGLVGCSLPPFGPWFLGPIGLGVAAWTIRGRRLRARAFSGLLVGLGQFTIGCVWALEFTGLGYVVLVAFEAAFIAVALAIVPSGRGRLLAFAGSLTILEWARDHWPFGGLAIGSAAIGQAGGPLAGLARVGGPLAVGATVALAGAGLAAVVGGVWPRRITHGRLTLGPALAGLAAVGTVTLGAGLAGLAPDGGSGRTDISVAIVQGGGRRGIGSLAVPAGHVFAATQRASSRVRPPVDLVVWPEDAVPLAGPLTGTARAEQIANLARRLHTTVLAGVTSPVGGRRFLNEIVAWGPSGRIVGKVEKAHPVPFGEYVPLRAFFSRIASLSGVPRDMIVGPNDGELTTPAGRLAILNSFEAFFADRARSGVRAGGELLVVETNTASYATDVIPAAELAASRLQAIAEGRTLVQAATTGYSAVVDPDGTVVIQSQLGSPDLLRAQVALRTGMTLYARFGDWPVLAAAALALAGGWGLQLGTAGRRGAHMAPRRRHRRGRVARAA
jgi:apolipoprotein N-acyltransferase